MKKMLAEIIPEKLLDRVLNRFDLFALYFALIFGSYGAAQMTADGWAGIPMLLIAAVTFLLPTALASYELGTLFPGEGGIYIWAHKSLGPIHGFIAGWLSWVPIFLLLPLGVSVIVGHIEFIIGTEFSLAIKIALQAILIIVITFASILKLKLSQKYINIMFFVAFLTAVIVFVCGFLKETSATPMDVNKNSFNVFKHGAMYSAAILWLLGVEVPFNMGAEIKDTKRNSKFMLLWGSVALILAYTFGIYGVLKILPVGEIDAVVGISAAVSSINHGLGILVAFMICFAVVSQDIAYMNSYSRLLFISGIERRLPKIMSHLTSGQVPLPAMIVQCVVAIFIIIILSTNQNLAIAFQIYLAALVVVWVVSLYYLYTAIFIVRKKYKSLYENPNVWKIPGGKIGKWLVIVFGLFFNSVAIYYVFAAPWSEDLSVSEWRWWLTAISLVFIVLGALIYLSSLKRVRNLDVQKEIEKYEEMKEK